MRELLVHLGEQHVVMRLRDVVDDALRGFTNFMDGGPSLPMMMAALLR